MVRDAAQVVSVSPKGITKAPASNEGNMAEGGVVEGGVVEGGVIGALVAVSSNPRLTTLFYSLSFVLSLKKKKRYGLPSFHKSQVKGPCLLE